MADGTPGADDPAHDDAELAAAVDDALADELKRQKARFIQRVMDMDRAEGVGRSESFRHDSVYRDLPSERRDERDRPPDPPAGGPPEPRDPQ